MDASMSTEFRRLSCETGCCLEKVKFLAEEVYKQQDTAFNILSEEAFELTAFIEHQVYPYLRNRSESGDVKAQDLLIDLSQLVG
jgi:hypothetical protein